VEVQQTTSFEQLANVFSFSSPTAYMLMLAALAGFVVQILALIAGPLVMIERDTITIKKIFPRTMEYFFRYVRLIVLLACAITILFLISYLLITIITVIAGMVSLNYIDPTLSVLAAVIPNVALFVMAVFFVFAPFILLQDQSSAYQALVLSAVLVRPHFWMIMLRLVLVLTCVFVIGVALSFIPYIGLPLSGLVGSCLMTVYTYVLYEDVTKG
jgi:hypothetical protein